MSARINNLEQNVEALYKDIRYGDPHTRWYTLGKLTSTLFVGMVGGGVSSVLGEGAETASVLGAGGKTVLKGTEGSVSSEAINHINGLRLQRSLTIEQARSIFTETGELAPEIIKNSYIITRGNELHNPKVISDLLERGGNLSDWGKYRTVLIKSPSDRFEMHFYRNRVTGDVYYGRDYKAVFTHQGRWNAEATPQFDYQPSDYNLY